jgi:tRNA U54 and U55 pseudouridine synthase Pus10
MLGDGRPFMLEVVNPRRVVDEGRVLELEGRVNEGALVRVAGLVKTDVTGFAVLKKYED